MPMPLQRHQLLDISDQGRAQILAALSEGEQDVLIRQSYAEVLLPEQAGVRVPGVVRREDGPVPPGQIPVGFSSPVADRAGQRLRIAAFTSLVEVTGVTTPYELLTAKKHRVRNSCHRALGLAQEDADKLGLTLGVWGSMAQELYSGLPCTNWDSDLDLLVQPAPHAPLQRFLERVNALEEHFAMRVDIELDLPNGYGVPLKELFGRSHRLLGKGLKDVTLFSREEILASLPQAEGDGGGRWHNSVLPETAHGHQCNF